jgi:hypothetical protein
MGKLNPLTCLAECRATWAERNLVFAEIAKLVGEHWQNLPNEKREEYIDRARVAHAKWRRDMEEYKQTPQYREYQKYLEEFKEKHPSSSKGLCHGAPKPVRVAVF